MAIYYWKNHGRLGNLLFQYAGILRYLSAHDRVYSFYNEVFDLLDVDPRVHVLSGRSTMAHRVKLRVDKLALFARRLGLVGVVEPKTDVIRERYWVELPDLRRVIGTLRNVFVSNGYHQDGRLRDIPVRIKSGLTADAKSRIAAMSAGRPTVGVHIRLTDYAEWSVLGAEGAMIPAEWYLERLVEFRRRLANPMFVVFSDDIAAAQKLLRGNDVLYFHGSSALQDFAGLAVCDHAVISPSSFAWWAACLCENPDKIVMAPEFWVGFKSSTWYPPTIMTQGTEYYPVQ